MSVFLFLPAAHVIKSIKINYGCATLNVKSFKKQTNKQTMKPDIETSVQI